MKNKSLSLFLVILAFINVNVIFAESGDDEVKRLSLIPASVLFQKTYDEKSHASDDAVKETLIIRQLVLALEKSEGHGGRTGDDTLKRRAKLLEKLRQIMDKSEMLDKALIHPTDILLDPESSRIFIDIEKFDLEQIIENMNQKVS